jgi:ParB-like chromosome segregation protein Spo0J
VIATAYKHGTIAIAEIAVKSRVRQELGDVDELCRSIEELGLLHPVVVTEDKRLVSGQRRLEAYRKLGRDKIPATIVKHLDDAALLLKAERDENTCRKAFTVSEAVAMGQRLEVLFKPAAAERKAAGQKAGGKTAGRGREKLSGNLPPSNEADAGKTRDKVAPAVGMAPRTYEKAKAVIESGDAELIAEMDATGKVDAAYKKKKDADKKQERAKQASAAKQKAKKVVGVHHGDFRELGKTIADNSAALVFTDPPYDRESLPLFDDLGELAARVLVDGGSLITFCGQYVLPEVMASLGKHLRFFWICCCQHTGDSAQMREYGIKVKWKPMLWFVKGSFRRDRERWIDDLIVSAQQKSHHDWQQSDVEARHFIEVLTDAGEMVVDPFCGGGTTAATAAAMGRKFWTCEIDAHSFEIARERIGNA